MHAGIKNIPLKNKAKKNVLKLQYVYVKTFDKMYMFACVIGTIITNVFIKIGWEF